MDQNQFLKELNEYSSVNKVIAVMSGKGGVGKSLVTSLLASNMARRGYRVAILDADITGPSIPQAFSLHGQTYATERGIMPSRSHLGIHVISLNLLVEDEKQAVVWRGPILADMVRQFWTDVFWDNIDYMFVDMPPGTGDVPLTVFQSLPVDGVVLVTSPQDLVSMIVAKAMNMIDMMKLPAIGLVENMSYFKCPNCGEEHKIFGESHIDEIAAQYGLSTLCKLPLDPELTKHVDGGTIEDYDPSLLDRMADEIEKL